jgi:hypothetical protein
MLLDPRTLRMTSMDCLKSGKGSWEEFFITCLPSLRLLLHFQSGNFFILVFFGRFACLNIFTSQFFLVRSN